MAASILAVCYPFRHDLSVLTRYWDGPHHMYLAKTLYDVPDDHPFTPPAHPPEVTQMDPAPEGEAPT